MTSHTRRRAAGTVRLALRASLLGLHDVARANPTATSVAPLTLPWHVHEAQLKDGPTPTTQSATFWKPVMLRLIQDELTAFEAKHQLGRKDSKRLEKIVSQAGCPATKVPGYRRLYECTLRVQREKIMAPARSKGVAAGASAIPTGSKGAVKCSAGCRCRDEIIENAKTHPELAFDCCGTELDPTRFSEGPELLVAHHLTYVVVIGCAAVTGAPVG